MNRVNDVHGLRSVDAASVDLPALNWASIGQSAPRVIANPSRVPSDPLPLADIVVITWTSAEWSALDHVFVNSSTPRSSGTSSWSNSWMSYEHNVGSYSSGESSEPLWGEFRLVSVPGATRDWTVLLFHSNAHLQYQPYIAGLRAMVQAIIADAKPTYLYSIGTAGAGNLQQRLGDAIVTNGGTLLPGAPPNSSDSACGQTFTCTDWFPPSTLYATAQQLMFPLSQVVTEADLQSLFKAYAEKNRVRTFTLAELLNAPLQPANLGSPTVHQSQGVPLNTSCDFGMAPGAGSSSFCAYEEDDAVVGETAGSLNVKFAFIRNVSDTVIPDQTQIPSITPSLRQAWASVLYERYGLITASNGAIATWAAIAAS